MRQPDTTGLLIGRPDTVMQLQTLQEQVAQLQAERQWLLEERQNMMAQWSQFSFVTMNEMQRLSATIALYENGRPHLGYLSATITQAAATGQYDNSEGIRNVLAFNATIRPLGLMIQAGLIQFDGYSLRVVMPSRPIKQRKGNEAQNETQILAGDEALAQLIAFKNQEYCIGFAGLTEADFLSYCILEGVREYIYATHRMTVENYIRSKTPVVDGRRIWDCPEFLWGEVPGNKRPYCARITGALPFSDAFSMNSTMYEREKFCVMDKIRRYGNANPPKKAEIPGAANAGFVPEAGRTRNSRDIMRRRQPSL